jgi:hypothetical protein
LGHFFTAASSGGGGREEDAESAAAHGHPPEAGPHPAPGGYRDAVRDTTFHCEYITLTADQSCGSGSAGIVTIFLDPHPEPADPDPPPFQPKVKKVKLRQCWGSGSAGFWASWIRIYQSQELIRLLPFSHTGVERTEIMLAKSNFITKFQQEI